LDRSDAFDENATEREYAMIQAMPKVHPGIEEEKCSEKTRPAWQRPPIQQAEVVKLGPLRSGPPGTDENEPNHDRVQDAKDKIF
jgi:hypothetical protein